MGYQESVIKVKKEYQNDLIREIVNSDIDKYIFCEPYYVIEVKKDIKEFNFKKNDKLIYICGERDGQRSLENFIQNTENQVTIDSNIENVIYPVEDLQNLSLFEVLENMDDGYGEDEFFKINELDKYKEKFNKYELMKNKHEKMINAFPIVFAFNEKQFEEAMRKLGLTKDDTDKIFKIDNTGGFIRKTDNEAFTKMLEDMTKEQEELIKEDKTGDGFIKDMFKYELINHEYNYTYELDDTLKVLGLSYEEVMKNPKLKHGLELAKKEILFKEQEQDYYIE